MTFEIIPNWHPVFVHFTIGLLLMAAVLYLFAWAPQPWGRWALLGSRINVVLGILFAFATVGAGFLAFNSVVHDDPSHAAMKDHRNWALGAAALWALVGSWEIWRASRGRPHSAAVAVSVLVAAALLGVAGSKGGELVFRHGLGVQSLPNTDTHEHGAHEGARAREAETPSSSSHVEPERSPSEPHPDDGHTH